MPNCTPLRTRDASLVVGNTRTSTITPMRSVIWNSRERNGAPLYVTSTR